MKQFVSGLNHYWNERPFVWGEDHNGFLSKLTMPVKGHVLVLAPHPDDPESVAVTCRLLKQSGCDIRYGIVTMSPAGVEDVYAERVQKNNSLTLQEKKIEIRRREQLNASKMLGLSPDKVSFLGLQESKNERSLDTGSNRFEIIKCLEAEIPDIVILPVGRDTNRTHVWVCSVFQAWAKYFMRERNKPIVAMYNEDPKTTQMRDNLFVIFNEQYAKWKGVLLRAHDSQQMRNIKTRRSGFDDRILEINRHGFDRLPYYYRPKLSSVNYAEVFELELFDFS